MTEPHAQPEPPEPPPQPLWAIVPALDLVDLTLQTCRDLLGQSLPTRVLLVDQGSSAASNTAFRQFAEQHHPRVLLWSFNPPLPSLSAAWNKALGFVWALGGQEALVVNSDVQLHKDTAAVLTQVCVTRGALFVSALGVGAEQFAYDGPTLAEVDVITKGGPDFSCFLLTQRGHLKYPFDEGFVPAFMEDCDCHRRYMLGGDGERIFSVNLPFHHIRGGSRTINQSDEARTRFERQAPIGRKHYQDKWGGPPNQERRIVPYAQQTFDGVTNPDLQDRIQRGGPVLPPHAAVAAQMHDGVETLNREFTAAEAADALSAAVTRKAATLPKEQP